MWFDFYHIFFLLYSIIWCFDIISPEHWNKHLECNIIVLRLTGHSRYLFLHQVWIQNTALRLVVAFDTHPNNNINTNTLHTFHWGKQSSWSSNEVIREWKKGYRIPYLLGVIHQKNIFNNAHETRKHYHTLGHPLQNMHINNTILSTFISQNAYILKQWFEHWAFVSLYIHLPIYAFSLYCFLLAL